MKFNYQARTKEGQVRTGTVEASSREAALALLEKYGLYVTLLEGAEAIPVYFKKVKFLERVSRKDVVAFSRQLAVMFKSNIPIVEIFYTLAKQTKNLVFREKIIKIAEEVEGGTALSRALTRYPKIFDPFYTSMVKSGEASGELTKVLDYLADHLERDYDFRSKVIGAMLYPVLVFIVVLVVVAAVVLFIIPRLSEILKEAKAELPFMTKLVLQTSDFLRNWGWILLLVFFVVIILIFQFSKTKEGKKTFDKFFLRLPVISGFLQKIYLSRFAENLATLTSGGLPIAQALEITGEVVGNDVYKTIILKARDEVRRGETISAVLERYPRAIPPLVIQMTVVGEKTGRLGPALMNIVGFYQKEVDRTLDSLVSLLEPILIIFLGIVVGGLVISVLMPIYQIGLSGF
ncbi:type II secretion system F family protein [Patescibacteria group bacterium]|nr:type II secretion system F family protein [Patescibacteria group bacterium]